MAEVNGVVESLCAAGEMAMYVIALLLREMKYFTFLMVASCVFLSASWAVYVTFTVKKHHLWRA